MNEEEGWGYPTLAATKVHYFRAGRSLCGKYGCFGIGLTPDDGEVRDRDCLACTRKLRGA